jgi:hypothetical protein
MADYAQVHADDSLMDAIGRGVRVATADPMLLMLMAWRAAVDAIPLGEPIPPETAAAVVTWLRRSA